MSSPHPAPPPRRKPEVELIAEDGIPMETAWHRDAMNQLIEVVECAFAGQQDFYVGGNMFLYYSEEQVRNRDFLGPDFFFVWGVNRQPQRQYWVSWREEHNPHVIIELTSPSTADEDRTTKFEIYERVVQTPEYFIYDPQTHGIQGWRRKRGRYRPLAPNAQGWLWSEELEMWLGSWDGAYHGREDTYPRFYDAAGNLVPRYDEVAESTRRMEAKSAEEARAEAERQTKRADDADAEAQKQTKRADDARVEAERLAKRADDADAEAQKQTKLAAEVRADAKLQAKLAADAREEAERLRARLAELEGKAPPA